MQCVKPRRLVNRLSKQDVIVFHKPISPRAGHPSNHCSGNRERHTLRFYTKGDGNNAHTWPTISEVYEYDPWVYVSQDIVERKVVMRVPWIGMPETLNRVLGVGGIYMAVPVNFVFTVVFFAYTIASQR